jgi:hypothetical protein
LLAELKENEALPYHVQMTGQKAAPILWLLNCERQDLLKDVSWKSNCCFRFRHQPAFVSHLWKWKLVRSHQAEPETDGIFKVSLPSTAPIPIHSIVLTF